MTLKKNMENEIDDRWRTKGSAHSTKIRVPKVCSACRGTGTLRVNKVYVDCMVCNGTGERI